MSTPPAFMGRHALIIIRKRHEKNRQQAEIDPNEVRATDREAGIWKKKRRGVSQPCHRNRASKPVRYDCSGAKGSSAQRMRHVVAD